MQWIAFFKQETLVIEKYGMLCKRDWLRSNSKAGRADKAVADHSDKCMLMVGIAEAAGCTQSNNNSL